MSDKLREALERVKQRMDSVGREPFLPRQQWQKELEEALDVELAALATSELKVGKFDAHAWYEKEFPQGTLLEDYGNKTLTQFLLIIAERAYASGLAASEPGNFAPTEPLGICNRIRVPHFQDRRGQDHDCSGWKPMPDKPEACVWTDWPGILAESIRAILDTKHEQAFSDAAYNLKIYDEQRKEFGPIWSHSGAQVVPTEKQGREE